MRQGNGSELPGIGPNDPRSQSIGIIDVSPTDDRKSVLAGILTQEKLNRKQIAVILPAQNKAFQRPQDFDDLKSIRRKLQAEIVFIVPGGPGLADFARQRRFPVYSTLESFADSLQSEANNPPPAKRKSGGLFGGARPKAAAAGAAGAVVGAAGAARLNNPGPAPVSVAPQSPLPAPIPADAAVPPTPRRSRPLAPRTPTDENVTETQPQRRGGSTAGAAAAGAGAGFLAADLLQHDTPSSAAATPSMDNQDDWDLPPVPSRSVGQSPSPYSTQVPDGGPISPLPPTPPPSPIQNNPDAALAKDESVPGIIDLPRTKRNTTKLPVGGPGVGAESPTSSAGIPTQPPPTPPSTPPVRAAGGQRNSGYIPAALGGAAVGAAAGTALGAGNASASSAMPPGAVKSSRVVGGGSFPPQRVNPGAGRRVNGRQRRKRGLGFWLIAALLLLIASLLVCSFAWYSASPSSFASTMHNIVPIGNGAGTPAATVTITPNSQIVQDSYLVHAVPTSTPDAALHQVTLRTITFKTPDLTKPITGTGRTVTAGVRATGKIHFVNGSSTAYTIAAGTVFHAAGGIDIANNDVTTVAAATVVNGNRVDGAKDDDATAVQPGANGDIAAGAVNLLPCCGSTSVSALSTSFSGGQDPQNYTFIKTTDVSSVVDPQKAQLLAAGQKGVHDQVKANEQMVNDITCRLAQPVDQTVGPDTGGQSITTANVTLVETCTAQVYDQGGEQALVRSLLNQKATGNLGPGYALVGNIMLAPGNSTLNSNDLDLVVGTKGVWVYQFTAAQKQSLLKHIAGKTSAEARTYLQSQTGVSGVKVDISNGGGTLPTDTTQITFNIQSIAGASGGSTTPAPTVTTNGPGSGPASTPTVTGFGLVADGGGNGKG